MWNVLIFLFFIFQDLKVSKSEDVCVRNPTEVCGRNEVPRLHVPHDEADLSQMCSQYLRYADCLEDYENTCPDGYITMFYIPRDSSIHFKLLREICRKDSIFYTELSIYTSCIHTAVEVSLEECKNTSEVKTSEYYEFLKEKLRNDELSVSQIKEDYFVMPPCIWHNYKTACLLANIESECSNPAAVIASDIIQRSTFPLEACRIQDIRNLKTGFLKFLEDSNVSNYLNSLLHAEVLVGLENGETLEENNMI